jgi:DNA-binding CsgD family transcriptional regulator
LEAVLAMHERRTSEACALFDRLRSLANRLEILEPCVIPWSGDAITAYLYGGRIEEAVAIIESLELMAERLPCQFPRIVATGARAALTQAAGDLEATTRMLEDAAGRAAGIGMPVLEARIRARLGGLLRRSGQDRTARPQLRRAIELSEASGAEGLLAKVSEEMKLAGGRQRARVENPDELTPAELRVRHIAEQGLKTKQIASELFVTQNTIETHLQRIYRKLGINSQRELIALARHAEPRSHPNGGERAAGG